MGHPRTDIQLWIFNNHVILANFTLFFLLRTLSLLMWYFLILGHFQLQKSTLHFGPEFKPCLSQHQSCTIWTEITRWDCSAIVITCYTIKCKSLCPPLGFWMQNGKCSSRIYMQKKTPTEIKNELSETYNKTTIKQIRKYNWTKSEEMSVEQMSYVLWHP